MALALVFDTLTLVAGAVWAQDAWGRFWAWDPLETWSPVTWLLLGLAIHAGREGFFPGRAATETPTGQRLLRAGDCPRGTGRPARSDGGDAHLSSSRPTRKQTPHQGPRRPVGMGDGRLADRVLGQADWDAATMRRRVLDATQTNPHRGARQRPTAQQPIGGGKEKPAPNPGARQGVVDRNPLDRG